MIRKIILSGLLLLIHFCAISQHTISGTVFQDNTDKTLCGASIYIKQNKTGVSTNSKGYFTMSVAKGTYKLEIAFIGYKTQYHTIKINNNINMNFHLKEKKQKINEILIRGKSEERKIREKAMPISIISMKEIKGSVNSVNDILSKTAGIKIRSTGATGSVSRISLRGLEGKRIGLFIDGKPLDINNNFANINDIPVNVIERIEIYKGIVPPKLGGSTIGGAINIVIKEFPPQYMDYSYELSSFNTHKIRSIFRQNNPQKDYELGVAAFYTYSDNDYKMQLPLNKDKYVRRDHDKYKKKILALGLTIKDKYLDEIEIEPVFMQEHKQIQGIEHNIQKTESISNALIINTRLTKENFLTRGMDLDANINYSYSHFQLIDTATNRYNWDLSTYPSVSNLGGEVGATPNNSNDKKTNIMTKINLNYILNTKSSINYNCIYNYVYGKPSDKLKDLSLQHQTNYNSKMNSFISGLSYEVGSVNKRFTNAISAKYYYYSVDAKNLKIDSKKAKKIKYNKNYFGFNHALRYKIDNNILLKASYSYDLRVPNSIELLGDGYTISPADNLKPERNKSINLGCIFDKAKNDNRLQLELNLFYMKINNMIRFSGGLLQSKYQTLEEMESKGIDLDIKWDVSKYVFLFANATYQDLRDTRKTKENSNAPNPTMGNKIPNIPSFYTNLGIEFHKKNMFGGKYQNTRIYAENSFVDKYFYDFEQSIYQERRIPKSNTYNTGIEHSIKNSNNNNNLILRLEVHNITNTKILSEFNRPLPGINYSFKIRYIIQ